MEKRWEIDETLLAICRDKESWSGSFYELSMAYKNESFESQIPLHRMQWLLSDPALHGVVKNRDQFGQEWQRIDPSFLAPGLHLYGYIHFPDGRTIGCGYQYIVLEDLLWLTLYIPLSMLSQIFPVYYPVEREKNPWIVELDHFLGTIGSRVYRNYPFWLAVMGEEATAFPLKRILADITTNPGLLVPETTFQQVGVNPYGTCLSKGLWWTGGEKKNNEESLLT